MNYTTRPLTPEARTRLAGGPTMQRSQFDSTWSATLQLLDRELRHLGVRHEFVMQVDCAESDLRLDGQLRANARLASPAVAIAVETKRAGSLLFVCGRFDDWRDNVRAIALGLESLRRVERYGIVQSNEQYRGWQALPPGTPMPAAQMTIDEAARVLAAEGPATASELLAARGAALRVMVGACFRESARRVHPDVGGDPADFKRLTEARDLMLRGQ